MRIQNRPPNHPGYVLQELYLESLGLSQTRFAAILGVPRQTISHLVHARRGISPEIALRLSRVFPHTSPESWLNLQHHYDLWHVTQQAQNWQPIQPIPMPEIEFI